MHKTCIQLCAFIKTEYNILSVFLMCLFENFKGSLIKDQFAVYHAT